jgi:bla regulator protein blaR1
MMNMFGEASVAIGNSVALSLAVKATIVTALGLIGARVARSNRASVRHLLLTAAFIVLLVLPFGVAVAPPLQIEVPGLQTPAPYAIPTPTADLVNTVNRTNAPSSIKIDERRPASTIIAVVWFAGALLFLLRVASGLWQLAGIRRSGVPWLHGEAIVRELSDKSGIKRRVDLLLHDAIPGPMTCGIVRPAIVCHADVQSWDEADLRRAILHELEHVRRGDYLIHGIAGAVCALYWFHPLVWLSWRRLSLEAERACDDAVLTEGEPTEYADQLVTLAKRITSGAKAPLLAMVPRSDLTMRVAAVLDTRQRRGRPGALRTAAALAVAAMLIVVISPLRAVSTATKHEHEQTPQARQEFEVASIKPNVSGDSGGSFRRQPGGRVVITNNTLRNIIRNAWNLQDFQIVGGPAWQNDDRWDINAKAPEEQPTPQQTLLMVQTLLADRFKLVVHNETREMPVYALVQVRTDGKLGPQLRQSSLDCAAIAAAVAKGAPPPPRPSDGPFCGTRTGPGMVKTSGVGMADFARNLSPATGRIVVNRTGLTGTYDLDLQFTQDPLGPGVGDPASDVPSLFVALQEQLGLRLEAQRVPVDVLVIDSAQRPIED